MAEVSKRVQKALDILAEKSIFLSHRERLILDAYDQSVATSKTQKTTKRKPAKKRRR